MIICNSNANDSNVEQLATLAIHALNYQLYVE